MGVIIMNLNEKILYNDFDTITINSHLNLECLDNSSILITGATGLIGSLLVKYLLYYNYKNDKNIKIITLVRDIKKQQKCLRDISIINV